MQKIQKYAFVEYERSFNSHNLRLVKVAILLPLNDNQKVFCQLRNDRGSVIYWQHIVHACLACTPLLRDTVGYLAVGLAQQSRHRTVVLNNVHTVPCEVMYIAFH